MYRLSSKKEKFITRFIKLFNFSNSICCLISNDLLGQTHIKGCLKINRCLCRTFNQLRIWSKIPLLILNSPSIMQRMIIRAIQNLRTMTTLRTKSGLIILRMILKFLPPMTLITCLHSMTPSFLIAKYKSAALPKRTRNSLIPPISWSSTIILPIMSIHTQGLIMLRIKRTPNSFKIIDKELRILWELVN